MLLRLFRAIITYPFISVVLVTLCVGFLGIYTSHLQIDASSKTLMLEDDEDLLFTNAVGERYGGGDFLVIAFKPHEDLLAPQTLNALKNLSDELSALNRIASVVSILNVPLLQSPVLPVRELVKRIPTLEDERVDYALAKEEFLHSPLYKDNLVSADFTTTALLLNLTPDLRYTQLEKHKKALEALEHPTSVQRQELKQTLQNIKFHRDAQREIEHQSIKQIRAIMEDYAPYGSLFLGGVNMIADDLITYVKHDVLFYGVSLLLLLSLTLWAIFRQLRFVALPLLICLYSVLASTGILGYFGWEVTVISSNFISLQLIITVSIVLHLVVRYRELALRYTKTSQQRLVFVTLASKATPSFFAIITTIAGFGSLIFSNIRPIITLGWMMSVSIGTSLVIAFVLFGAILALLPKKRPVSTFETRFALTHWCANLVKTRGNAILLLSGFIFLLGVSGASRLEVENSFINYFKSSTEIYKGMEIIDQKLGGTTPLDVLITFTQKEELEIEALDDFEAEFAQKQSKEEYWFSARKMQIVERIHTYLDAQPEIGSVQSLGTLLSVGKILNEGKQLDSFQLALLYNELPPRFRGLILDPYLSIEHNQVRFSTRVIDSQEGLRRDALLARINHDIDALLEDDTATHRLSGLMVLYNNMLQSLYESQITTLGFVALVLLGMFWLLFGSLKVALIAIVSNIIPMSIVFGLMGWAGLPLDMMTITIAAISIGIGVDDTIHYLHRFREELAHDWNYEAAMERSHQSIGYAMYYTSFAIILGFSILVVSNFIPTIYFGLLTVLVMAMVLLGALLLLPRLLIVFRPWGTQPYM
ncbi:MMPL family transporter [Sulfurospirillum sp. T05]|uniref:MMPL family transporter n=1 Tax=Sulfurospirillum tamanense TaxID=2813362 RepID=A0ABS2WNV6_9BACT|nr:MMPL family transporter [Sulfurospirillum tamanensis]MBN2963303.1 MMPL family transporter [Sulfurospirillum tamanensis]